MHVCERILQNVRMRLTFVHHHVRTGTRAYPLAPARPHIRRLQRLLHAWHGETESGAESGRGREELLTLLNEQRQINSALEEVSFPLPFLLSVLGLLSLHCIPYASVDAQHGQSSVCMLAPSHFVPEFRLTVRPKHTQKHTQSVGRYKELHNKTEIGLRRHEDLLSKREKQMIKIEKERSELSMRVLSAEQEVTRLRDMNEKHLNENMLRKAAAVAPPPPPATFGG